MILQPPYEYRLLEKRGDEIEARAIYILIFAIVGTAAIVLVAGLVRRRRSWQNRPER